MNVSEQIVEMLVEAGIKRIYAVTGDSLNHLNDAVRKNGQIQWIHVRHEEAGAFAAAAEAELDGLACCAGSCGPGHIHLINGLYEANKSHLPVLAIASAINTDQMGMDYFQETNTIKLFEDCSVYNQMLTTAEQVPRMVQTAIQHAYAKKGVAVIGLPGDLSEEPATPSPTSTKSYFPEPVIRPNDKEIAELAKHIEQAKNITIYCGIGAINAHEQIVELSQLLHAPVAYSFRGKMGIAYDNPNEIGLTGLLGLPSAYHAMHHSDLVLLLGTDFPYYNFMPTDNKIIQIDRAIEYLGRRAKLTMGLCGDIKDTLLALLPLLSKKSSTKFLDLHIDYYRQVQKNLQTYVASSGTTDNIQPEYATYVIDNLANEDTIFTVDTGMCCVWGARYITAKKNRTLLGSFNHGSMANAMPMAIGAQLSRPHQQVIALCGDGGISMLLGDLATIKQYNLPIKIFIYNNRSLGMVKLEMEVAGLMDTQTDMVNPDFALIGQAMGLKSYTVRDPDQLPEVISKALVDKGPVLVSIFTNPNALAMPPKVELDQVVGMTKSMAKLMLNGKMEEVYKTIQSNYKHLKDI